MTLMPPVLSAGGGSSACSDDASHQTKTIEAAAVAQSASRKMRGATRACSARQNRSFRTPSTSRSSMCTAISVGVAARRRASS